MRSIALLVLLLSACQTGAGVAGWAPVADAVNSDAVNSDTASADAEPVAEEPPLECNNMCCEGPAAGMAQSGLCTRLSDGKCALTCDANCAQTIFCLSNGQCTAQDGKCVLTSDADCAKSESCKKAGKCVEGIFNSGCTTANDADWFCSTQPECKQFKACKARDGDCIDPTNPTDCKHFLLCSHMGRCSWDGVRCTALSLADCAGQACGEFCEIKYGRCVMHLSEAACQFASSCKHSGRCHFKDGKCVALSDADCLQSTQCQYGYCTYTEKQVGDTFGGFCCNAKGEGCQ